MNWFL